MRTVGRLLGYVMFYAVLIGDAVIERLDSLLEGVEETWNKQHKKYNKKKKGAGLGVR